MEQEELTQLIALLLSDGSIYRSGDQGFTLSLRNRDKILIELFQKILINQGLDPYKRFGRRAFEIRVCSKKLALKLLNYCNTFRTLACESNPKCAKIKGKVDRKPCLICKPINKSGTKFPGINIPGIIKNNKELCRVFLNTFVSADGCVNFSKGDNWINRKIIIGCKHPLLRKEIKKILLKFNIKSTSNNVEIRIQNKKNIQKFRKEIGFLDGVKIYRGKHWLGVEKNKVLDEMINSFK